MMEHIRQIIPAAGWRVVTVSHTTDQVREDPVVGFALLEPPYPAREDGPDQPVVPMIRERGYHGGTGVGMAEIVVGDEAFWNDQYEACIETFVGYLSPGEDLTTPWVQQGVERVRAALADA